jgi:hypothetical protein
MGRGFLPPRGERGQGLKRWDDERIVGFFAGFEVLGVF